MEWAVYPFVAAGGTAARRDQNTAAGCTDYFCFV